MISHSTVLFYGPPDNTERDWSLLMDSAQLSSKPLRLIANQNENRRLQNVHGFGTWGGGGR